MAASRIMVVEDEPIVLMDVEKRLKTLGYEVIKTVNNGEDAIKDALNVRPDLILMDILLEGDMDGIDAASQIRKQADIPFIYLTAYADTDTLHRAKITEPFGYIIKPFDDRELLTCIEMALYKHRMEKRLFENERWLATTLRSIGDAVISTDSEGLIRFLNPMAEELTGLNSEEVQGKSFYQAVRLKDPETGKELQNPVSLVLKKGRSGGFREPGILTTHSNGEKPVEITAAAIHGEDDKAFGVVLVLRDISGTKQAEAALKQSLRDLHRTLEETVTALAITTEKRDPYTAGHQQRVAQLAGAMAREMGLAQEQIEGIRVASLLHDIGKIYIPAEILAKPARLTVMEMGIMKTHPEVGYDILKRVSFPWPVAEIVLQHHERIDGSGYPNSLKYGEIHLESKIIMVADVVEAMSSHRPYRASLGMKSALDEINASKGLLYDEKVVDTCMQLFNAGFEFE